MQAEFDKGRSMPIAYFPTEMWNRLGTKIIPKLKSAGELQIGLEFTVTVSGDKVGNLQNELRQILDDLGIAGTIRIVIE